MAEDAGADVLAASRAGDRHYAWNRYPAPCVAWLERKGQVYNAAILQPTSPLRTADDIRESLDMFIERKTEAVVSVCEVDHHPWWCNTLPPDGCLDGFLRPDLLQNRQQLPVYYRLNGAIYLARWGFIRERDGWYGLHTYAYVMPRIRSVDIDDEVDLALASILMQEGYTPQALSQGKGDNNP